MMHGVMLLYHNGSSAEITFNMAAMKEHLENQFQVTFTNRLTDFPRVDNPNISYLVRDEN